MLHAVIMAGGIGARFWPASRRKHPKQVIDLLGEGPMIQQTVERVADIVPAENRWIVTNAEQAELFKKIVPELGRVRYLLEPVGRNTAPAIGLAAVHLLKHDPDAVMIVLPADHRITDHDHYRECLLKACAAVENSSSLATIGVQPTRPETGYGYIQIDSSVPAVAENVYTVKTFAEKPNLQTAELFLESGEFLWNSGMFMWRADSIMKYIHDQLPHWHAGLMKISQVIGTSEEAAITAGVFQSQKGISIDYGVMEHAAHVVVVKATFDWSDVGSWDEVWRLRDHDAHGNALEGNVTVVGGSNNLVMGQGKLIAVIGSDNLAVVDTEDAILICPLDQTQRIREIVTALEETNKTEYL